MDHILVVQILDAFEGLDEESEGFGLAEYIFGVLMVEKVASFGVLHDHVDDIILDDRVPQFDNMRMVQFGVESDLPLN